MIKYRIPSWVLALSACLLWSTAFVGVKYSLLYAKPVFIAGFRFALAGLVLIPFASNGYLKTIKEHWRIILLISLFQTVLSYIFYFIALSEIKASTGAALVGLGPFIGAIMGHFFVPGDRFNKKKILSFVLGLTGVVLVSLGSNEQGTLPSKQEILGIVFFILNIISSGISNIIILRYKKNIDSTILTSSQLFFGGIVMLIISFIMYQGISFYYPFEFYIAILWLVMVSAVAFSLWYNLLSKRKEKLTDLNIWKFTMPVAGSILSWIMFTNDKPTLYSVLGIFMVAVSIFIFYSSKEFLWKVLKH